MPDNPIAGLYPQPAQSNQGSILSGNPLSLVGPLMEIQRQNAARAAGQAFQGALNPDGTVDTSALARGLQNPTAALAAPEAVSRMLANQGQGIVNSTNAYDLAAKQVADFQNQAAALIGTPGYSKNGVNSLAVRYARSTGVPYSMLQPWISQLTGNSAADAKTITGWGNAGLGPAGRATRVEAPPGPEGEPRSQPLGVAAQGGVSATGLPAPAVASQKAYSEAMLASNPIMENVTRMETALPYIKDLGNENFGVGSAAYIKARSVAAQFGLIKPEDAGLTNAQIAQKYLKQFVVNSPSSGRSDDALSAAVGSNASFDLTKPANVAILNNRIGMDKFAASIPKIYAAENPADAKGGLGFNAGSSNVYNRYDPSVFAWNHLSPEEQQAKMQSAGAKFVPGQGWVPPAPGSPKAADYAKFERSLRMAHKLGAVPQPGAADGQ